MLKGHTLIELKDAETGNMKRFEDENMLTNALDYILNDNLCGRHCFPEEHPELCFPIVRQLLGGIMLFPGTINEDAENIYPPTMPTGYGGSSTDAGDDTRMGTYNLAESGEIVDGYKHVWDFSTAQGNGDIECVCLTHRIAGNGLFNNLANIYYCDTWASTSYNASEDERNNENDKTTRLFSASQVVDFDGYRPITAGYDNGSIRILRWDIVTSGTGINSESDNAAPFTKYEELASFVPETVIETKSDGTEVMAFSDNYIFAKLSDGKYHGFCHAANATGDAVIYTFTIDPSNWTAAEGSFTVSGKQIASLAVYTGSDPRANLSKINGKYDFYFRFQSAIRGNYMYVLGNGLTEIYKINLNNTGRVTTLGIPFQLNSTNHFMRYNPVSRFIDIYTSGAQGDGKYRYGCILKDDTIAVGERDAGYGYATSSYAPNSYYFACAFGNTAHSEHLLGIAGEKYFTSGVGDMSEKHTFLGYLASINNISPFTKTAAQTMKITYTITETEEVTLTGIILAANPAKTLFVAGELLDLTGMQVVGVYSDGVRKDVTESCESTPAVGTQLLDTSLDEVSVCYEEDGLTRYTTIPVTVYELIDIAVVKQPNKLAYYSGDHLILNGVQMRATFSDGTERDVTDDCVYSPADGSALAAATRFVSVEYECGLVKKIETIPITVTQVALESIAVTAAPKTAYKPGDALDLSGMVVLASYNSGKTADVSSNITTSPANGTLLANEGTQNITITYSENNVTKTTVLQIYVTDETALASISVTKQPDKTEYTQGNRLDLTGIEVTATYTDGTTKGVTSSCVYEPDNGDKLDSAGTRIIKISYTEQGIIKTAALTVEVAERPAIEIVSWADGTDAQIAAMVAALDDGVLAVEDTGWQVGDERVVSLAAMTNGGYVGETQAAQEVTLVLMDTDHYEFIEPTAGGDTRSHFVVGLKNSLATYGYMNNTATNNGSWKGSKRRAWCNDIFRSAIPETLRTCFKQFKVLTAAIYNGTENEYTDDYFALFAEKEIFGSRSYSNQTEFNALEQIEYYKTAANRIKKLGETGSSSTWWERSPLNSSSSYFCCVTSGGSAGCNSANGSCGIAPFGCI